MRAYKIIFPPRNRVHKFDTGRACQAGLTGLYDHRGIALDSRANGVALIRPGPWLWQDGGLY